MLVSRDNYTDDFTKKVFNKKFNFQQLTYYELHIKSEI